MEGNYHISKSRVRIKLDMIDSSNKQVNLLLKMDTILNKMMQSIEKDIK